MADAKSTYEVEVKTTGDASGAKEVAKGIDQIGTEAAQSAAQVEALDEKLKGATTARGAGTRNSALATSTQDLNAALAGDELAIKKLLTAEDREQLALEQRKNAILAVRQSIERSEYELSRAQAGGERARAAVLERQTAELRVQLGLLQRTTLSEEQITVVAQRRVAAEQQIASAKARTLAETRAQAAAEREAAAASRVYGDKGRVGAIAQNFGATAGIATSLGLGVIAGQQLVSVISDYAAGLNKALAESSAMTAEIQKQVQEWQKLSQASSSTADAAELQLKMAAGIEQLREKLRGLNGESDGWIDRLGMFARDLGPFPRLFQGFQTASEKAAEALRGQIQQTQVFADAATRVEERSRAMFAALAELSIDEQYDQLATKIVAVQTEQEGLNVSTAEGAKKYAELSAELKALMTRFNEVEQARASAIAAEKEERAEIEKTIKALREKAKALDVALPKEEAADAAKKPPLEQRKADLEAQLKDPKLQSPQAQGNLQLQLDAVKRDIAASIQSQIDDARKQLTDADAAKADSALLGQLKQRLNAAIDDALRETIEAKVKQLEGQGVRPTTPGLTPTTVDDFQRTLDQRNPPPAPAPASPQAPQGPAADAAAAVVDAGDATSGAIDNLAGAMTDSLGQVAQSAEQAGAQIVPAIATVNTGIGSMVAAVDNGLGTVADATTTGAESIVTAVVTVHQSLARKLEALAGRVLRLESEQ